MASQLPQEKQQILLEPDKTEINIFLQQVFFPQTFVQREHANSTLGFATLLFHAALAPFSTLPANHHQYLKIVVLALMLLYSHA